MPEQLTALLGRAWADRAALMARCAAERTNAYRLFHGAAEGRPGLCVDRYGEVVLVQAFHQPLQPSELAALVGFYAAALPALELVYNDRSAGNSRIANDLDGAERQRAWQHRQIEELGVHYRFAARHAGQDPWLFLDLRIGRRRVRAEAAGKRVLNLFAYTCGVGAAAVAGGASEVVNIDFSASSLAIGEDNLALNPGGCTPRFVRSDAFAALRQLSGLGQPEVVRGKRMPPFVKLAPQQFDLVFLDPPRYAKSPFGVVDLVADYPALFKPALLATAPGGALFCCNNVAAVDAAEWLAGLQRSAAKVGRPIHAVEWLAPEADFPSHDQRPPLKLVRLSV